MLHPQYLMLPGLKSRISPEPPTMSRDEKPGCQRAATFRISPAEIEHTRSEDPPYETNGRVNPVIGATPSVMPRLMNVCVANSVVSPTTTSRPNGSREEWAILSDVAK